MKRYSLLITTTTLIGLFALFLALFTMPTFAQGDASSGSWLVRLAPGASFPGARHVIADWWQVDGDFFSLSARSDVIAVRPNRIFTLDDPPAAFFADTLTAQSNSYPDDPYYSYQWHLPMVQANDAWTVTRGVSVTVAVLDTGLTVGSDLACHTFVAPYNAVTDETGMEAILDDMGHGTHVAGTISQCTNNGMGVAGMAPDAAIMPVKVMADGYGSEADVARGIDWAVEHGASVINMSLGAPCDEGEQWPECSSDVMDLAIEKAVRAGVMLVAAAGNSGTEQLHYPANNPNVIAVSAVDYNGDLTWYSNFGAGVDFAAPGGDMRQDANLDGFGDGVLQQTFGSNGWGYYFMQGTSMATPHVAGAIALLRSYAPDAMPEYIYQALAKTALDKGEEGPDIRYGYGVIQTKEALDFLNASDSLTETIFAPFVTLSRESAPPSSPPDSPLRKKKRSSSH